MSLRAINHNTLGMTLLQVSGKSAMQEPTSVIFTIPVYTIISLYGHAQQNGRVVLLQSSCMAEGLCGHAWQLKICYAVVNLCGHA